MPSTFLGAAAFVLLLAILIGSPIAALRIDRARKLAELRLYAADMFAAQQAFENGNLGRARDFLKAHWPTSCSVSATVGATKGGRPVNR